MNPKEPDMGDTTPMREELLGIPESPARVAESDTPDIAMIIGALNAAKAATDPDVRDAFIQAALDFAENDPDVLAEGRAWADPAPTDEPAALLTPADTAGLIERFERAAESVQEERPVIYRTMVEARAALLAKDAEIAALKEATAWRPIETAPRPAYGEPQIDVLLAWGSRGYQGVGEGYWRPDDEGFDGAWWWANTSPGDYHADPISERINGSITHWLPLPDAPVGAERDHEGGK